MQPAQDGGGSPVATGGFNDNHSCRRDRGSPAAVRDRMQTATLLALAFIMFSLGTTLRTADFTAFWRDRRTFGVAVACHMLLLPLLGFSIAAATQLSPSLAVGLVLIAACPSGATSNYLTYLARG